MPEAQVGHYVILYTGFSISRLDEEEARETLWLMGKSWHLEQRLREIVKEAGQHAWL
jgi:hydrogenase maturation factor